MDFEKEIKIVNDDDTIITYQMIETDEINRQEIADIKLAIEALEKEVAEKNAKIEELKNKVAFAEKIIALADEKKATEIEVQNENAENDEQEVVIEA